MPGVVVANEIDHGHASVRPFGQQRLETDEAFGDQRGVFNVFVEDIADEVEPLDGGFIGP